LVKNNFTLSNICKCIITIDSGTTFAPLFITPLPSVGCTTISTCWYFGINNVLTAKPATVAAAAAGIAAGYPSLIPAVIP
jgi:hypothetical protein